MKASTKRRRRIVKLGLAPPGDKANLRAAAEYALTIRAPRKV